MNAKCAMIVIGAFGLGLAVGKYGGSSKLARDRIFPVEGLRFDDVRLMDRSGTRDVKIMTISHQTPTGPVRYGRGVNVDRIRDFVKIEGSFCGEKITLFGQVVDPIALTDVNE